jgi:hydroxypyruvate reductase
MRREARSFRFAESAWPIWTDSGHVRIVAAGKAAAPMLESLLTHLGLRPLCELAGVLIAQEAPNSLLPGFQFFSGGHPYPSDASFAGARAVLSLVRAVPQGAPKRQEAICIFLISGALRTMMELLLDPSIPLVDTVAFHRALVLSGGSITEINCIRTHFPL